MTAFHPTPSFTPFAPSLCLLRAIFFALCLLSSAAFAQVTPLPNAHAHNDYEHEKPLLDALSRGFTSIEADIYLIDGELYVAHNFPRPENRRTLKELYLEPLRKRIAENGGVYAGAAPVFLMVDIKSEAEATYQALKKQLVAYADLLNYPQHPGPVTVILSGNRATGTVHNDPARRVGIDGRPSDLEKDYAADFMPLISDNYANVLRWRGEGEIPEAELNRLKSLTERAHARGMKVRLWASPENEAVWKVLRGAGADLISTDQLERLRLFLGNQ